jgi:hypothetical protein
MTIAALALGLPIGANAEDAPSSEQAPREWLGGVGVEPDAGWFDIVLDGLVVRPLRLGKIPMGFGIFLASLPMYLVAWDVPNAWDFLVVTAVDDAIFTPIGRL